MKTLLQIIILLLVVTVAIGKQSVARHPNYFIYSGSISDQQNRFSDGILPLSIRLLNATNKQFLYAQNYHKTHFRQGKFAITVGNNIIVESILKNNLEILLEITINKQLYSPLIKVHPAGHTNSSANLTASAKNTKPQEHKRLYTANTAVQAVALQPANSADVVKNSNKIKSNPFVLPMKGPVTSATVASMPSYAEINMIFVDADTTAEEHEIAFAENGRRFGTERTDSVDDKLAIRSLQLNSTMMTTPQTSINFEGLSGLSNRSPADVAGAVGREHYVQMVNNVFAVYDKSGVMLAGPIATNTLWLGFGGPCEDNNDGDAIALYDQQADRYILSQFAFRSAQSVCFAVSTTNDPLGSYFLYELPTQRLPDYYKLGVWSDALNNAYFMGTNSGIPEAYDVYAIDRESLLAGTTPRMAQFFQGYPNFLLPADQDGSLPAPIGSPGLFYTIIDGGEEYFSDPPPATDSIDIYAFNVDWEFPANSTFTLVKSFKPPAITDFIWTVCGLFQRSCLPQANTSIQLDSGSWWPMQRFQYRNFGAYETLLGSWTVDTLVKVNQASPRWFELRKVTDGNWQVFQEGTFSPDFSHRWMSSIAMNGAGDIAMVYNILNAFTNIHPGVRYTARKKSDALGMMRVETSLIEGGGVQTDTFRWGDYSSMDIDPVDDCRFWFGAEYIEKTGNGTWQTRIGSFDFPDCVAIISSNASQEVCTMDDNTNFELNLAGHFNGTTNLAVSNCPTGANCDFSINPVVNPATNSQLQVAGFATGVIAGDYQITVSAADLLTPSLTTDTVVALRLVAGLPNATTLLQPLDDSILISTITREFSWMPIANTSIYQFELATDTAFSNIVVLSMVAGTQYIANIALNPETQYYWRITTGNVCGDGVISNVYSFTTSPLPGECLTGYQPVLLNDYDFETGMQGWSSNSIEGFNNWIIANNNPATGSQHLHITDVSQRSDTSLTSPIINLPTAMTPITLHFTNFQDMEASGETACWDGGMLEISIDGGNNFTQIVNSKLLTDAYDGPFKSSNPLFGKQAWCGNPQEYLESIININAYVGQSVLFRFRMATDSATGGVGWDIDRISIQACAVIANIFNNSFE